MNCVTMAMNTSGTAKSSCHSAGMPAPTTIPTTVPTTQATHEGIPRPIMYHP
jgi:hypothetical protein